MRIIILSREVLCFVVGASSCVVILTSCCSALCPFGHIPQSKTTRSHVELCTCMSGMGKFGLIMQVVDAERVFMGAETKNRNHMDDEK